MCCAHLSFTSWQDSKEEQESSECAHVNVCVHLTLPRISSSPRDLRKNAKRDRISIFSRGKKKEKKGGCGAKKTPSVPGKTPATCKVVCEPASLFVSPLPPFPAGFTERWSPRCQPKREGLNPYANNKKKRVGVCAPSPSLHIKRQARTRPPRWAWRPRPRGPRR